MVTILCVCSHSVAVPLASASPGRWSVRVSETAAGQQRRAGEGCVGPCSPAHEQVHRTAAPPPAAAFRTTGKTHTEPTPRHRWAVVSATRVSARQGIPVQIGEARVRFRRWRSRRAAGLRHACVDHERRWRNRGLSSCPLPGRALAVGDAAARPHLPAPSSGCLEPRPPRRRAGGVCDDHTFRSPRHCLILNKQLSNSVWCRPSQHRMVCLGRSEPPRRPCSLPRHPMGSWSATFTAMPTRLAGAEHTWGPCCASRTCAQSLVWLAECWRWRS